MSRSWKLVAGFLAVVGTTAACDDFLTGPGLTENPNQPTAATASQILVGIQAQQFVRQQGQLARQATIYMQQLAGVNNQQLNWGSQYLVTEGDVSGQMSGFYLGGGLRDMRNVQELAREQSNPLLEGIAKVWEAFTMGTATSIWGDLPYREAVDEEITDPVLDPQEQIYQDIQALLDEAIVLLGQGGPGAGAADVVYGSDADRWIRAAYTLKARYHLHTAEQYGQSAYQAALDAAELGINEPPGSVFDAIHGQGPGDFRAWHGGSLDQANIWAQFLNARGGDIRAGNAMIEILVDRDDPRLPGYFDPIEAGSTEFRGADQFGDPVPESPLSELNIPIRRAFTFRQPLITWAENELIMAEAKLALGDGSAGDHLDAVRASVGLASEPATLENIMTEKYIVMFQNIEAWSDHRRTCIPTLVPGGPSAASPKVPAAEIPRRLPYGRAERENNTHIPTPPNQPANNWANPNSCF